MKGQQELRPIPSRTQIETAASFALAAARKARGKSLLLGLLALARRVIPRMVLELRALFFRLCRSCERDRSGNSQQETSQSCSTYNSGKHTNISCEFPDRDDRRTYRQKLNVICPQLYIFVSRDCSRSNSLSRWCGLRGVVSTKPATWLFVASQPSGSPSRKQCPPPEGLGSGAGPLPPGPGASFFPITACELSSHSRSSSRLTSSEQRVKPPKGGPNCPKIGVELSRRGLRPTDRPCPHPGPTRTCPRGPYELGPASTWKLYEGAHKLELYRQPYAIRWTS